MVMYNHLLNNPQCVRLGLNLLWGIFTMLKKYVSPQLTKLGSLYSITNAMAGGYADMMGGNMMMA
jgi:hypothetical protein